MLSTWLQVLKFLHAEGVEGCTVRAMDWAAKNGHLETVKWLHEIKQVPTLALVYRGRGSSSAWSNPVYGPVPCSVYLSDPRSRVMTGMFSALSSIETLGFIDEEGRD